MRIAIFTDIHHHDRDVAQRHCTSAMPLLREIFTRFADPQSAPEMRPDLALSLGDLIMAGRKQSPEDCRRNDARNLNDILTCFAQTGFQPIHHIHGNHEDKNLSRSDVAAIAAGHGADFSSKLVEQDGLSLVLWSPGTRIAPETNGASPVPTEELNWLETTLARVSHPAIVLTHLPLDGDLTDFKKSSLDGRPNPVFGRKILSPDYFATHYPNAEKIRDIIAASGKIVACLAGHAHWNEARMERNVAYITLPSLVENADGRPHGGWAMLHSDSQNRTIQIDVHGATPCRYRLGTDKSSKSLIIQLLNPR